MTKRNLKFEKNENAKTTIPKQTFPPKNLVTSDDRPKYKWSL